jgi:flagella basal body P-ring formation protein FlgA
VKALLRDATAGPVLAFVTFAAGAGDASIGLRSDVRVPAGAVTLGQVADLHSTDLALLRKLVDLPLGRAPAAGASVLLTREAVETWVARRAGVAPERLEWQGPEASRVTMASRTIQGDEIARAARSALGEGLKSPSGVPEIQLQATPRDLDVPEGALRLQARPLGMTLPRERATVWVDVWVAERFVRTVAVGFQLAGWPPGAPGTKQLEREAPPDAHAPAPQAASHGAPPSVLQRGEWATLRSGAGAVALETRVEVLQDGRVGDRIRVRQPGAAGGVLARVAGPGVLEMLR